VLSKGCRYTWVIFIVVRNIIKQILREEVTKSLTLKGKIVFDPDNVTRKHNKQKDWKRVAMVTFDGEMTEYYSWFIERRYGLKLNRPLRGAHVTFVNDSVREIKGGDAVWEEVRKRWDGKEIDVILNLDVRTNSEHWWMKADETPEFWQIRGELGLGRPFWGLHMTVGYANERNIEHSKYIHGLIQKGFAN
jgi:hypothetical protein